MISYDTVSQQPPDTGQPVVVVAERLLMVVALAAAVLGTCLIFHQLAMTGMSADERCDFDIAVDFVNNHSFLTNQADPSQGRLNHLLGAASLALLGVSCLSFKLPFAIVQVVAAVGLWLFLRRRIRPVVAVLFAAMYVSCPYVLSGARAGGSAGDGLVCALTLAYIITQYHYTVTGKFWPHGFLCAASCGAAIGAKWTCGLLLVAAALTSWLYGGKFQRRLARANLWIELLALQWTAVIVAMITCPTLLLGIDFVRGAIQHSQSFNNPVMAVFGVVRQSEPWYYVPAVMISKVSPVQIAMFLWAVVSTLQRKARKGAVEPLVFICLVSTLPALPLVFKVCQNAQYYIGLVPAMTVLPALMAEKWLKLKGPLMRGLVLCGALLALTSQIALSVWLFPDYLQAGRQFGTLFQGQFQGPAINHCQGMPFVAREVNRLISEGVRTPVYMLEHCREYLDLDVKDGPVRLETTVRPYPETRPAGEHLLIIASIYDYNSFSESDRVSRAKRKDLATSGCLTISDRNPDFVILRCGEEGPI